MKNSTLLASVLAAVLLVGCRNTSQQSTSDASAKRFDPAQSDPKALRIADEVMVALGGRENYEAIKYLSFRYVMEVDEQKVTDWRHDWDRRNNNYRLEGYAQEAQSLQGDHLLVVFNLDTKKGLVFKNGQLLESENKIEWLNRAYARYTNDTYWLLMPFKLKDPGAVLKYERSQEIDGIKYDVLRLSYADSVDLRPWNIQHIFVDPATRLVHRWEYGGKEGADFSAVWWENWRVYDGITLAELRTFENSNRKIRFLNIVASRKVDEQIFEVSGISMAKMP
ncbi:MAG: hypothetical protein ONB44_16745 [candidate division KSB1 bacterium]|nr:hypothetical protein [candidate division KSB1 bacterium]MDZ7303784.1 hypothetical protein [candidate division KSB1 bacterium]MDZ7313043.1 hypothetical protein [candidate division KSB1 bacterium]